MSQSAEKDVLAKCPRCGGTSLSLTETYEEHGTTDFGPLRVIDGRLICDRHFWFEAGNVVRQRLTCACGHEWACRRQVDLLDPEQEQRTRVIPPG